jgi:hypothetical protein
MKTFLAVLLLFAVSEYAAGQGVRGTSERQAEPKKPDLTAGGGNSSVGPSSAGLPEDAKARFGALDLDDDGRVSLSEAAGHEEIVRHFDRADRNKDGLLTYAEYQNLGKKPAKAKKESRRNAATGRSARPGKSPAGTSSASKQ